MAEFQEVMRQWKRLCIEMGHRYGVNACANCPCSQDEDAICDAIYDTPKDTNWPFIEIAVVSWAADHPEPVYPTWAEWLNSMGFTKHDTGQFCVRMPNQYSYEVEEVDILNEFAYKPIHADIAQKLGIAPKKGTQ